MSRQLEGSGAVLSDAEEEAIRAVLRAGAAFGYGNMISHLKTAWAKTLMDEWDMTEESARLAAGGNGYPFAWTIPYMGGSPRPGLARGEAGMAKRFRLGQDAATFRVTYNPGRYRSEGPFPEDYEVIECRVLAEENGVVALVKGSGKVVFRRTELVFESYSDVKAFCEGKNPYELEDLLVAEPTPPPEAA